MKIIGHFRALLLVLSLALGGFPARAETEVTAGRSAAGQLKANLDFEQPLALGTFPGFPGYATGEVGFHSASVDDPANDFYQLSGAADLRFVLLAKDPGMEVLNDHGSAYMQTNESFYMGPPAFDTHPLWNITNEAAGRVYSLTLQLRDVNGVYSDSAPFTLSFTPLIPPQPIYLQKINATNLAILWPTNAAGWELQSADVLNPTGWVVVTNSAGVAGTNFFLPISSSRTQQFFRLSHP